MSAPNASEWSLEPVPAVLDVDRKALETIDGYEAAQLETVRKKAEKWLGATTALASLSATVLILDGADSIRKLDNTAQNVAGVCTVFAAVAFTVGIVAGYNAAFGSPSTLEDIDTSEIDGLHARLRQARETAAEGSQELLAQAVFFTIVGLAAMIGIAGVSWFGNDAAGSTADKEVCFFVGGTKVLVVAGDSIDVREVVTGSTVGPCVE